MAKKQWKWQARYDALSYWHKFLFHQNPRQWVDAWSIEEAQSKYLKAVNALKRLAFIQDDTGYTYGSTLTDVGRMADYAEHILKDLGEL